MLAVEAFRRIGSGAVVVAMAAVAYWNGNLLLAVGAGLAIYLLWRKAALGKPREAQLEHDDNEPVAY
jgi:hypothetical protein